MARADGSVLIGRHRHLVTAEAVVRVVIDRAVLVLLRRARVLGMVVVTVCVLRLVERPFGVARVRARKARRLAGKHAEQQKPWEKPAHESGGICPRESDPAREKQDARGGGGFPAWTARRMFHHRGMSDATNATGVKLVFPVTGAPAEVLEIQSSAPREPGPGEVLVRMCAAPINPADLNTIEGTYGVKLELPATPGIEGSGVVEVSNDEGFSPGDAVIFLKRADTWATHTTVPASSLFKLPAGIDPVQAAMLKVNPATAWQLLHGFADLEAGDWIVQNLGNSAVGRCVIQLARELGIRTISFVRSEDQFADLRALGADEVLLDDDGGLAKAKELLGGPSAKLAFNAVGGDSALRLMKLLGKGGTHVTYGAMAKKPITLPNGLLLFQDIRLRGLWVTRWVDGASPEEVSGVYQKLAGFMSAGKLIQPVDSTYPPEEWKQALTRLDAPDRNGKVLFRM